MIKTNFKAHPIMIIKLMKPYLFVLVLPIVRAVIQYFTKGEIDGLFTLETAAFVFVLIIAVLRWRSIDISVNDKSVTVKNGVIIKNCAVIEVSRLSSVVLRQGPFDLIFKSVECSINTEAGTPQKSDFSLKMYSQDAKRLFKLIYGEENREIIKFSAFKIAVLAATTSSAATGIIVGIPIINQTSELLGIAISDMLFDEINVISEKFSTVFPPVVNAITLIFLVAYSVSFLISFFKNLNFKLQSGKDEVDIQSGVIVRKRTVFKKSQVNNVCLEQTPLLRLFKRFSMRASIGGYGNMRGEKAVVIPVAEHAEIERQFKVHFPMISVKDEFTTPKRYPRALFRFLYIPTLFLLCIILIGIALSALFPYFDRLVLFLTLVLLGIDVYYATVCYRNYKYGGLSLGDCVLAAGSEGFIIRELYCNKNKIGVIKITQTPADRKYKTCKVKITVRSENADSVKVKNLDMATVEQKIENVFIRK